MKRLLINFLKAPKWARFLVVSVIGSIIFILLFALFNPGAKHILLKSVISALVLVFYGTYLRKNDYSNQDQKQRE